MKSMLKRGLIEAHEKFPICCTIKRAKINFIQYIKRDIYSNTFKWNWENSRDSEKLLNKFQEKWGKIFMWSDDCSKHNEQSKEN